MKGRLVGVSVQPLARAANFEDLLVELAVDRRCKPGIRRHRLMLNQLECPNLVVVEGGRAVTVADGLECPCLSVF